MRASGYVLYTCGQLGVMMLTRYFFQWIIRFSDGSAAATSPGASDVALFSAAAVGAVFFAFRIFDAVIDPVIGLFADGWSKRGRDRRSLLWLSFPLAPLGLALVFTPALEMAPALRWGLLGAGMLFFFFGYSLYIIPYWSLIDDYAAGDARVRTRISNAQGVGLLLATGVGFVLSPIAVARWGFRGGAVAFALLGALLMVLPYFAGRPARAASSSEESSPGFAALAEAFRDRKFRAVVVLFAGAQMSFTVMTAAAPYIAERLLGGTLKDVALLLGPFLLAALPSFVFVPRIAARLGWEKFTLLATVGLGVAYSGAGLLGQGIVGSPLTTAMIVFACAGPAAAVILGLEAEAITRSAAETGHGRIGIYFGLFNFVVQALNGFAVYLMGILAEEARTSVAVVRFMPFLAGALCLLGVVLYLVLRRANAAAPNVA